MTPENKKLLQQWVGGCLIAALFFYLFFYLGKLRGESICSEKPNSSKEEIQVVVKDSVETQRLRTMLADLRAEFDRYKRQSERTKKFLTNKINENETFKQKAIAGNDSALYHTLDSLLTRYGELSVTRKNENGNSGGF